MGKQQRMPNMQQMLKQIEKMQRDIASAQEALEDEVVHASAGGGMVKVEITGELVVKSIEIDPEAVDPEDVEMLCDMVLAAVNDGLRSAQEIQTKMMEKATGGLGGPGGALGPGGPLGGGLGGLGLPGM
ncbi:MAG: YbaB/EbfC family nucleoid-associated protein [Solirubrobacteraceae bacterium]